MPRSESISVADAFTIAETGTVPFRFSGAPQPPFAPAPVGAAISPLRLPTGGDMQMRRGRPVKRKTQQTQDANPSPPSSPSQAMQPLGSLQQSQDPSKMFPHIRYNIVQNHKELVTVDIQKLIDNIVFLHNELQNINRRLYPLKQQYDEYTTQISNKYRQQYEKLEREFFEAKQALDVKQYAYEQIKNQWYMDAEKMNLQYQKKTNVDTTDHEARRNQMIKYQNELKDKLGVIETKTINKLKGKLPPSELTLHNSILRDIREIKRQMFINDGLWAANVPKQGLFNRTMPRK